MKTIKAFLYILLSSGLILSGCGGGGGGGAAGPTYTGETTPVAIIDNTNAEALSAKTVEGVEEAILQKTTNDSNPYTPAGINITSNTNQLNSMLVDIANTVGNNIPGVDLPVAITYSYTDPALGGLFCGGSITVSDSFINNYQTNGTLNGSMTLHNLCYSDVMFGTIIMNGTIRFSQTTSQTVIQYSNFSINDGSSIENINMTVTCGTSMTTCSISTDFEGSDGQVYRMADVGITTNFDDGSFNINATFYHPDHGSVNMIASRITLGCTNGHPDGGSIHITTEDLTNSSSATIVFRSDCTGYDGTYNDGAATGSISVDWPQ